MLPVLSIKDLEVNLSKHITFLCKIYPFLVDEGYHKECIELRPISRDDKKFIKSFNFWRIEDKSLNLYLKFLKSLNGKAVCLYYSGYTMDYSLESKTIDGKVSVKGKINKQNSIYTQILPMDFDNVSREQFEVEIKRLKDIGIETINVFTGHGYQSLILLKEKYHDKDLFKKFTSLMLSKGFSIDPKIVDASRVLRLPYTFNCKEFDKIKFNYENPEALQTNLVSDTELRYDKDYIFDLIENSFDTVFIEPSIIDFKPEILDGDSNSFLQDDKPVKNDFNEFEYKPAGDMYPMLNFDILPDAVQRILTETPENYRDSALMFLVPFFRNRIGLSLDGIIEAMKVWNSNCNPPEDVSFTVDKVKRIYSYDHKGTGAYTADLAKKFGFIEFEEFKLKNKVTIPNILFQKYSVLHKTAVRIYLMMKTFESINNISEWDFETIAKYSKVSTRTVKSYLKLLVEYKLIDKKRGNKKAGISDKYYISQFIDTSKGFVQVNRATLRMMVYDSTIALSDSEIMVFTYIYSMIHGNFKGCCNASQQYIGDNIGLSKTSVSEITDILVSKGWISKKTYTGRDGKSHCNYYLMF